jgi:hypothetical protein
MASAVAANHDTVGHFYQAPTGGPGVNRDEGDPAWIAERDRRLREHQAEDAASAPPPAAPPAAPPAGATDQQLDGGAPPGGAPDAGTE